MLGLYRKEITCFFLIILSFGSFAQVKTKFQPNYDAKPIHFGYYIGFANTHYDFRYRSGFLNNTSSSGTVLSVTSPSTTMIRAGAMINYYVNDYFDIRFSPLNISVLKRSIEYIDANGVQDDNQNDKSWLEFPVHVKYKSERRNNSRMYIFGGARMGFETNIINRKGNKSTVNRSMRTNDLMIEYGVGLEIFREYFKVTPELHFSHGLFNMIRKDDDRYYLEQVKSARTHNVSLVILFQ